MLNSLWPHGCSPPGSSVHGILQTKTLERVAIPFLLQGIFLTQGSNLVSTLQADSLPSELPQKPRKLDKLFLINKWTENWQKSKLLSLTYHRLPSFWRPWPPPSGKYHYQLDIQLILKNKLPYGFSSYLLKYVSWSPRPLILQNVALFGKMVYAEIIKLKWDYQRGL